MANEGKDEYQPDPKKIEEYERESKRAAAREEYKKAIEESKSKENAEKTELISVSAAIRRSSGKVAVPGMIIGVSTVVQMTTETKITCANCKNSIGQIKHTPPLFSVPVHLSKSKKCALCDEYTGFSEHKEISAMVIQLQDDTNQNDLESLSVVLFDNDTLGVRNGEKVIVKGDLHVVQQKSNGKRVTFLFTDVNCGIQRVEDSQSNDEDVEITRDDIIQLTELSKRPDYIEQITSWFAPTVIGHADEKLGVILMYIGALENQDFRGRLHLLFIGPPGLGKTKLAQEARELGKPNSRYTSAKGAASGKSITVIIDKENDTYTLRLGVLLQAHGSVCVINEISALSLDEQGHLYDVMEEGKKTIDSYTFHKEIAAQTSVLATTNPLRGKWQNDTVSTGQIPLTLPHLDRYDLIFVFKSLRNEQEKIQYAKSKFEIFRKYRNNGNGNGNANADEEDQQLQRQEGYVCLRKIIKHAKSFEPELSEEAENMIMQCWTQLSSNAFPTNRIFETLTRVSITFARLRFSNVVTLEIAKEAIDFLTKMYKEFDQNVSVVHDPRDAACFEIANYLQENPNMPYDFADLINRTTEVNPFVEAYLGASPVNANNSKYRDIANRFKEGLVGEGFITIERENPLRLCFRPDKAAKTSTSTSTSTSAATTTEEPMEKAKEPTVEELQAVPQPRSIYRLGHSDLFACENCSKKGDIWEMKKHAINYSCKNKKEKK
jgi:replicative DNA helicase Mcm